MLSACLSGPGKAAAADHPEAAAPPHGGAEVAETPADKGAAGQQEHVAIAAAQQYSNEAADDSEAAVPHGSASEAADVAADDGAR